jgi:hypothetical protein
MKINNNNDNLNTFTTLHGLISLDNKWLGIYIKKNKKIIKSYYLEIPEVGELSHNRVPSYRDISHGVLKFNHNKKSYYNINNILMSYMYLDIKQVNKYVPHLSHNEIITS